MPNNLELDLHMTHMHYLAIYIIATTYFTYLDQSKLKLATVVSVIQGRGRVSMTTMT